ncbi:Alcohol dehydrogenase, iron-type [Syntrophomonas zehnderi OL-4]|uniref:Alcohol dehydrogenase, iron-type n=1 Tax=Syntrophomonas zehnderi OL-4 TaxID=690567 RepID=A0A0E3W355_9FIRM|nr:iron-containing alcohol dehydrogenase family protein [Syntrophomonas zehnderi]CFX51111.1 Alcohol dehydrogenase, iron-type [Syntrophomonas zehnderi OL-4]
MIWRSYFSTQILFGNYALRDNCPAFSGLGKRALIVVGQGGSARRTGALDDLSRVLKELAITAQIFDQVEANPTIATVRQGAAVAKNFKADFIVGIGGGSPLDAAKAIAVLAVNEISDTQLLDLQFGEVLPVVAIPTTAGTGSEVTPYSILTFPALQTKKSIPSPKIIPRLAVLDPRYMNDLPWRITADTAVDAYSHALESFLAVKANPLSELHAREALQILGSELRKLAENREIDLNQREALLYGSLLAGLAISSTGTSIPHAMGYPFTYFKDVPHGRANGMIMPAYMDFNLRKSNHPKITDALIISGFKSTAHFKDLMVTLCGNPPALTSVEQAQFITQTMQAKNLVNNIVTPDREDLEQILTHTLNQEVLE